VRTSVAWLLAAWLLTLAFPGARRSASADEVSTSGAGPRQYAQGAPPAERAEIGSAATLVPFGTMTAIIVWRTPEAMQDGIALARANAPAIEVYPLVSCIAESGAKVTIVDHGEWDKHYVISVTDGPHVGCRGAVLNLNVKR
jgi:hypothetical protein